MTEFEDEVLKLLKEILALLKINKRPNNAVLVPCDKLAEMQAEIESLKKRIPDLENINKPNPFIGWEKNLVAVDKNPNSGLGGVALKKAQEK